MSDQYTFMERLCGSRTQLEQEFDQKCPPELFAKYLELLNDLILANCTVCDQAKGDIQKLIYYENLGYLGLALQYLWGAVNLARQGLYSPAYALLRSALENELRWELAQRKIDNEGNLNKDFPDILDRLSPDELRDKAETNLWINEGIRSLYAFLCGDVHLRMGSLDLFRMRSPLGYTRMFNILQPTDDLTRISIKWVGSHEFTGIGAIPRGFFVLWQRLVCRIATRECNERFLRDYDEVFPPIPSLTIKFSAVSDLVKEMWKHDDCLNRKKIQMSFIDIASGSLTQEEFPPEDANLTRLMQLPISDRDMLVPALRNTGKLPVPECSLHLKWLIVDEFMLANPNIKKDIGIEEDRHPKFAFYEDKLLRRWPDLWLPFRDACLLKWFDVFKMNLT